MSDFLTADEILAFEDIPSEVVIVPEWGNKKLIVRGLDGEEASKFSSSLVEINEKTGKVKSVDISMFMPRLLSLSLHNVNGERIFREDQVRALGKKSAMVLKRLGDIASRLSGLNDDAMANETKNSEGTLSADSQ